MQIPVQYINKNAIENNTIMKLLYKITYPASYFFAKKNISPNTISIFSLIFAIISNIFFLLNFNTFFSFFWVLSLLLDFCDGTVARILNKKSSLNFNIDHYFDLIKIYLILFSTVYKYFYSLNIFIFSFTFLFLLFFIELMNHDLNKLNLNIVSIKNFSEKSKFIKIIYTIIFSFNAHTLFLFILLTFNDSTALILLIYLNLILLKNFTIKSYQLLTIKKTQ